MSERIAKAWITPFPTCERLATLSIESACVEPEYARLSLSEITFPAQNPQHHVVKLALLDDEALAIIRDVISIHLASRTTGGSDENGGER